MKFSLRTTADILIPCLGAFFILAIYAAVFGRQTLPDGTFFFLRDDPYIALTYARSLATGQGLVWHAGMTAAPVEGFTSLLLVLVEAPLFLFFEDPARPTYWLLAGLHALTAIIVYTMSRRVLSASPLVSALAVLLICTWTPLFESSRMGWESMFLVFLTSAGIGLVLCEDRTWHILGAVTAGLLVLARPDGAVPLAAIAGVFMLKRYGNRGSARSVSQTFWENRCTLLCFVAPALFLTAFRFFYYGELVPNTYFLKMAERPGRIAFGWQYLIDFLIQFEGRWWLVPLIVIGSFNRRARWQIAISFGLVLWLLYVLYIGGDAWTDWRFFCPVLPLFLVLFVGFVDELSRLHFVVRMSGGLAILILIGQFAWSFAMWLPDHSRVSSSSVPPNIELGRSLAKQCDRDAIIALFFAGAPAYYSRMEAIDMLGKSDKHIARLPAHRPGGIPGHDKFDFDYVLQQKPDLVQSLYPPGQRITPELLQLAQRGKYAFGAALLAHPLLQSEYREVMPPVPGGRALFVRKSSTRCWFPGETP